MPVLRIQRGRARRTPAPDRVCHAHRPELPHAFWEEKIPLRQLREEMEGIVKIWGDAR